jgi:type IV secretory pathway component VirB8
MKRAFICVQGNLKENCVGDKVIMKSSIVNYISLKDTYDLATLRKNFIEIYYTKTQQEDYTFVVTSISQID